MKIQSETMLQVIAMANYLKIKSSQYEKKDNHDKDPSMRSSQKKANKVPQDNTI